MKVNDKILIFITLIESSAEVMSVCFIQERSIVKGRARGNNNYKIQRLKYGAMNLNLSILTLGFLDIHNSEYFLVLLTEITSITQSCQTRNKLGNCLNCRCNETGNLEIMVHKKLLGLHRQNSEDFQTKILYLQAPLSFQKSKVD